VRENALHRLTGRIWMARWALGFQQCPVELHVGEEILDVAKDLEAKSVRRDLLRHRLWMIRVWT
jgi:hypothetical protein